MPKLKSHSGAKERFSFTKSGKVKRNHAFRNHFLGHKTQKQKRGLRRTAYTSEANAPALKKLLPYA